MKKIDKSSWYEDVGNTLDERIQRVVKITNEMENTANAVKRTLNKKELFEKDSYFIGLEELGTFLLKSEDVESCREIENSFYETERDYRSRYEIGKNSYSTDFTHGSNDIPYANEVDLPIYEIKDLYEFDILDNSEMKKFIRIGLSDRNNLESPIFHDLNKIYYKMLKLVTSTCDNTTIQIFILMCDGLSEVKIAEEVNLSQAAVNKRIAKMCKIIRDY